MPYIHPTNRRIALWMRRHPRADEKALRAALSLPRGNPEAIRFEFGADGRLHARRPWILAGLFDADEMAETVIDSRY